MGEHNDAPYAVLKFTLSCVPGAQTIAVDYQLLFDIDQLHRGLLSVDDEGKVHSAVLSPQATQFAFARAAAPDLLRQALVYGKEGVWHIWTGFDHVLFLLSLLLPVVLVRENGAWLPAVSFRTVFVDVLKVVTAFTVAHSATLTAGPWAGWRSPRASPNC